MLAGQRAGTTIHSAWTQRGRHVLLLVALAASLRIASAAISAHTAGSTRRRICGKRAWRSSESRGIVMVITTQSEPRTTSARDRRETLPGSGSSVTVDREAERDRPDIGGFAGDRNKREDATSMGATAGRRLGSLTSPSPLPPVRPFAQTEARVEVPADMDGSPQGSIARASGRRIYAAVREDGMWRARPNRAWPAADGRPACWSASSAHGRMRRRFQVQLDRRRVASCGAAVKRTI